MSRKIILWLTGIFIYAINLSAQSPTELLDSAANYYSENNFEKAIDAYQNIIEQGYESSELYFNLGNSFYKSNKIALAIVYYEKAKKLDPKDEDIEFNLRLANTYVVDKIDVLPEFFLLSWWDKFIQMFSSNSWAIISMAAFVIGLVLLLMFFLSHSAFVRQFSFWLGVLIIVISVFSFSFSRKQHWLSHNEPDAIILTPSVVVKSSPSEGGTELFLIHEGLKVTVTDKLGEWREVKLSDGNEGWIKASDLIII